MGLPFSAIVKYVMGGFNPLSWFAKGEPGAWYDPSDISINWRRNLLTYTEDFSNAAWTKSGITPTYGASDPEGGNTATSLKASVGNGQIYRNLTYETLGIQTVWLRRKTGVGAVGLYNGSAVIFLPVTSSWTPFYLELVTKTYYILNIVITSINDEVDIWHPQVEQSSSASTYQKITDGIQDYYTVQPQPVLFQDSAGTTPVTAIEQPVGLMLDKSRGLALGAETIGEFLTPSYWSIYIAGPTFSGTSLDFDASSDRCAAPTVFTTGKTYKCQFTFTSTGVFTLSMDDDGLAGGDGSLKTYKSLILSGVPFYFTATASNRFRLIQGGAGTASVTNFSVKQIAGNHAFQATAGNRPMLSARVNLLTYTEDFSNAVWVKQAGIVVNTSRNITIPSSGSATIYQNVAASSSVSYTALVSIQGVAGNTIRIQAAYASGISNNDKVLTGGVDTFSISFTTTATATNINFGFLNTTASAITVEFYKIDLRPTNSGALLPAYQRVNTASDYDTVGFPLYLKANGLSSAMATNSIDFTSTDKMTVVTGVRKLSDAATGTILETSTTYVSAGAFSIETVSNGYFPIATGSALAYYTGIATYTAPINNVFTLLMDISQPSLLLEMIPRINGVINQSSPVGTLGSSNWGNYPLYLFARAGTSLFLNGQFYGAIIRGAASDTASVTQTENYMATKTGITF